MKPKLWVPIVFATLVVIPCAYFGREVPFSSQWSAFEALRTTAAIVLAVVGAWISVLFPDALQNVFGKRSRLGELDQLNVTLMLWNLRVSSIILAVVMLIGLVAPLLKSIHGLVAHHELLRGISYALVGGLTVFQFWTLLMTLAQANIAKEQIEHGIERRVVQEGALKNVQLVAANTVGPVGGPERGQN